MLTRTVWASLVAYHVLEILGGTTILFGLASNSVTTAIVGGLMLVAGLAVHLSSIVWSIGRVGVAAREAFGSERSARAPAAARCLSCWWQGATSATVCPRCGRPVVPSPSRS